MVQSTRVTSTAHAPQPPSPHPSLEPYVGARQGHLLYSCCAPFRPAASFLQTALCSGQPHTFGSWPQPGASAQRPPHSCSHLEGRAAAQVLVQRQRRVDAARNRKLPAIDSERDAGHSALGAKRCLSTVTGTHRTRRSCVVALTLRTYAQGPHGPAALKVEFDELASALLLR